MKNYCVKILPVAQQELIEILDYIALELCSPLAAINLNNAITEEFKRLQNFPLSGTELKSNLPFNFTYRWVRVENYMIFYTISEDTETIHIMHICFASSDYLAILS